ncbi:hypothetical protein AVEN_229617-1 [Araneus ventricosus]|uniref:Uncharacterized protein n=1 Tax=Araneus ventricosus TaxID=182803 RepID=A0A4Y2ULB0_ARAVE|nr:hypothetical protein AVEN_229617-1 [Araneus ventricosus]
MELRTVRFMRGTFPAKHRFLSRCAAHCGSSMLRLPPQFTNDVRQHLNVTFGKHWICCGGPVHWPARTPGLSCLNFFCWGQMKTLVHETPVYSVEDAVAHISVVTGRCLSNLTKSHLFIPTFRYPTSILLTIFFTL